MSYTAIITFVRRALRIDITFINILQAFTFTRLFITFFIRSTILIIIANRTVFWTAIVWIFFAFRGYIFWTTAGFNMTTILRFTRLVWNLINEHIKRILLLPLKSEPTLNFNLIGIFFTEIEIFIYNIDTLIEIYAYSGLFASLLTENIGDNMQYRKHENY